MGCGSNTTTTSSGPPPAVMQAYQGLMGQANNVSGQPLQQYGGPLVAGFTPDQLAAFGTVRNTQGIGQPYYNQSAYYANASAQPIRPMEFSKDAIDALMSPYIGDVVDATQNQFNNSNAQQVAQIQGNAATRGAYGGDREAVVQALTAGQQKMAQDPVIAGLYNTGYGQALGEFNALNTAQIGAQEATGQLQRYAGNDFMNLGDAVQRGALSGADAQMRIGALQQQQAQQQLNIPYQMFMQQQAYPFQTTGWLANMIEGLGGASGGVGSTTQPPPSMIGQLAGLGTAGAGIYGLGNQQGWWGGGGFNYPGAQGDFNDLTGISGWNPNGNRGGRVGYDAGGGLGMPIDMGGGVPMGGSGIPDVSLSFVPTGPPPGAGGKSPFGLSPMQPNTSASHTSDPGIMGAVGPALSIAKFAIPYLRGGGRVGYDTGGNPVAPIIHAGAPMIPLPQSAPAWYGPATLDSIKPLENYAPRFDQSGYPQPMQAVPTNWTPAPNLTLPMRGGIIDRAALNPPPAPTLSLAPSGTSATGMPPPPIDPNQLLSFGDGGGGGGWRGGNARHFDAGGALPPTGPAIPDMSISYVPGVGAFAHRNTMPAPPRVADQAANNPMKDLNSGISSIGKLFKSSDSSGDIDKAYGGIVGYDGAFRGYDAGGSIGDVFGGESNTDVSKLTPVERSIITRPSYGEGQIIYAHNPMRDAAFSEERAASHQRQQGLGREDDLANALGMLRGYQVESPVYPRMNGMTDVANWPQGSYDAGGGVGSDQNLVAQYLQMPIEKLQMMAMQSAAGGNTVQQQAAMKALQIKRGTQPELGVSPPAGPPAPSLTAGATNSPFGSVQAGAAAQHYDEGGAVPMTADDMSALANLGRILGEGPMTPYPGVAMPGGAWSASDRMRGELQRRVHPGFGHGGWVPHGYATDGFVNDGTVPEGAAEFTPIKTFSDLPGVDPRDPDAGLLVRQPAPVVEMIPGRDRPFEGGEGLRGKPAPPPVHTAVRAPSHDPTSLDYTPPRSVSDPTDMGFVPPDRRRDAAALGYDSDLTNSPATSIRRVRGLDDADLAPDLAPMRGASLPEVPHYNPRDLSAAPSLGSDEIPGSISGPDAQRANPALVAARAAAAPGRPPVYPPQTARDVTTHVGGVKTQKLADGTLVSEDDYPYPYAGPAASLGAPTPGIYYPDAGEKPRGPGDIPAIGAPGAWASRPAPTSGRGYIPPGSSPNRDNVVGFWSSQGGVNPAAAEGIADRVAAESGFKPNNPGDRDPVTGAYTSDGMYQHHLERLAALKAYAAKHGTPWDNRDIQNQFALAEATGSDPDVKRQITEAQWQEIKNAPTREQGQILWDRYFERSKYGPGSGGPITYASGLSPGFRSTGAAGREGSGSTNAPGAGGDVENNGNGLGKAPPAYTPPPSRVSPREPGIGANPWLGLVAAGLGMMASRSPHPGVAIGEGGLQGVKFMQDQEAQNVKADELRNSMDYRDRELGLQSAKFNQTTYYQGAELAQKAQQFQLAETRAGREFQMQMTRASQADTREERLTRENAARDEYRDKMAAVAQQRADTAANKADDKQQTVAGVDDKGNPGLWRMTRNPDGTEKREFFVSGRADVITADQRQKTIAGMAEKSMDWLTDPALALRKAEKAYDDSFGRAAMPSWAKNSAIGQNGQIIYSDGAAWYTTDARGNRVPYKQ